MDSIRITMLTVVALVVAMTGCSDSWGPAAPEQGTNSAGITWDGSSESDTITIAGGETSATTEVDGATTQDSLYGADTANAETYVDEAGQANQEAVDDNGSANDEDGLDDLYGAHSEAFED